MGRLEDLKGRKVVQWAIAYLAVGWVALQIVDVLGPRWGMSDATGRAVDVAVAVGFLLTLLLAWYHGERGRQSVSGMEAVLIAAVLGLGGVGLVMATGGPRAAGEDGSSAILPERNRPSIAVLPFENLSPAPSDSYFADGMHDEIIGRLGKISSLFVVARASVLRFEDSHPSAQQVARELGVDFVLTGSIRLAGQRVRLSTQLIDGQTEGHLWSETYNRDLDVAELFAIQDDLAVRVSAALSAEIFPEEAARLASRPTANTEAYQHYLRGLSHWGRRTAFENRVGAVEAFDEATQADPEFGDALAMLAASNLFLRWFGANGGSSNLKDRGIDPSELLEHAEAALQRAESLAPGSPSTAFARGAYLYYGFRDFDGALAVFLEADAAFPDNPYLTGAIGNVLRRLGRYDDALAWYLEQATLAPSPQSFYTAGQTAQMMRKYAQAVELAEQALNLAPDYGPAWNVTYNASLMAGDTAEAWDAINRSEAASGSVANSWRIERELLRHGAEAALDAFESLFPTDRSSARYALRLRLAGRGVPAAVANQGIRAAEQNLASWQDVADPFVVVRARAQLARTLAVAGERERALSEVIWVLDQDPMGKDALIGWSAVNQVLIASLMLGETAPAVRATESLLAHPSFRSTQRLLLDPTYRLLWDVPEFQALIERYDAVGGG